MKFVALDTETYQGKAFLLSCPWGVFHISRFADFLLACKSLGKKFVFYNLDYDVSALLKFLPEFVVKQIYLEKRVTWKEYTFRYLPGKYFFVKSPQGNFHFYDLFPFFQTSLDAASFKYLGKRKIGLPKHLIKKLSPRVYKKHRKLVDKYAIRDAALLQGLCDIILNALAEIGVEVKHLYSPGYIAKRYLKAQGVTIYDIPRKFRTFVERARFGARIEVTQRGYFPEADIYDIKSAYPFSLSSLPDLSTAEYYYSKTISEKWYFVECKIRMKEAPSYLVPYRFKDEKSDIILFPRYQGQKAVLSCFEYEYLTKNKLAELQIIKVLNMRVHKERLFAALIAEMYEKRAESPGKNIIFKLILNSLFGILSETIGEYKEVSAVRGYYQGLKEYEKSLFARFLERRGKECKHSLKYYLKECDCQTCKFTRKVMRFRSFTDKTLFSYKGKYYIKRERPGRFRNIALAALVTAQTRVQIFDLQRKAGKKFIACFTDSILTLPVKLRTGKKLGDLEKKASKQKLYIFGAGIYQAGKEVKTRGFIWRKSLTSILRKHPKRRVYQIPQKARVSQGIFVRRPLVKFADFNEILSTHKRLNLNFDRKRVWQRPFRNGADAMRNKITSQGISLDKLP